MLRSSLGADIVTRETAEEIPSLEGNIDLIVKTAANVPIKLYRKMENVLKRSKITE